MSTNQTKQGLVLVTGASGFIAKHTIQQLLKAGYRVRGTVRNDEEAAIARNAVGQSTPFSLVTADLTADDGWEEAVTGCHYVIHLASPYPLKEPRDREALVPIAKEGAVRVVKAALDQASVKRIVVVSSIVAMLYRKNRTRPIEHLTEDSWTDPDWKAVPAYPLSKTLAERAVWDLVCTSKEEKSRVVVVNPAMVWGAMSDDVLSTSSEICRLAMTGAYLAVPKVAYPIVDVRDVAELLVATLTATNVGGRRLIASADTMAFEEIMQALAEAFPKYKNKIPTRVMPFWLFWLASFFDRNLTKSILDSDTTAIVDTKYVTDQTGVTFRPAKTAVIAMGQSLIDHNILD